MYFKKEVQFSNFKVLNKKHDATPQTLILGSVSKWSVKTSQLIISNLSIFFIK